MIIKLEKKNCLVVYLEIGSKFIGKVFIFDFLKFVVVMDNEGLVKNVDFVSWEKCKRIYLNIFVVLENMIIWIKIFCNLDVECKV